MKRLLSITLVMALIITSCVCLYIIPSVYASNSTESGEVYGMWNINDMITIGTGNNNTINTAAKHVCLQGTRVNPYDATTPPSMQANNYATETSAYTSSGITYGVYSQERKGVKISDLSDTTYPGIKNTDATQVYQITQTNGNGYVLRFRNMLSDGALSDLEEGDKVTIAIKVYYGDIKASAGYTTADGATVDAPSDSSTKYIPARIGLYSSEDIQLNSNEAIPVNTWHTVVYTETVTASNLAEIQPASGLFVKSVEARNTEASVTSPYAGSIFVESASISVLKSTPTLTPTPTPLPEFGSFTEDFENNPKYSSSAIADQRIGKNGQAKVEGTTGVIEFDNAHSGSYVAGVEKKRPYIESDGSFKYGSSYRILFYNMFGLDTRTPLVSGSSWPYGWEMFTEKDIGREFEISLWVYVNSADGAYPYTDTSALENLGKVEITEENKDTIIPSLTVSLYGPGKSSANDAQTYTYSTKAYDSCVLTSLEWDTWTEVKLHYTVTADTIYNSSLKSNPLVNAIGVNNQEGAGYYASTFYVDDITVKELSMHPNILLKSENEIVMDVKIPSAIIDTTKDQKVIAVIYNKDTGRMIDAELFGSPSASLLTCEMNVDFNADMELKLFMWEGTTLSPFLQSVCMTIPTLDELKEDIKIDRISQTFYGDTYTQKGFSWYTAGLFESEIAYVEKTGDTPDWTKASYKTAEGEYMRYDSQVAEDSATRQKTYLENLKPNTQYFYRLGNSEFDVWSDTHTFRTADNTTNDAFFYLISDPQTSYYDGAVSYSQMMDYVYKNHPGGEFILSGGDLVIDRSLEQQWVKTFNAESFANPDITFIGAAGDHDTLAARVSDSPNHKVQQPWEKHFYVNKPEGASPGKTYYSFDYKDMHIAVLDTVMLDLTATKDTEQIIWLKEDMKNTNKKWKIVIAHEMPQSSKRISNSITDDYYRNSKILMPVFTELDIDLVIGGDTHNYSRTYPIEGYGGVLNGTTGKIECGEGQTALGNPDPMIVKTETINGKKTKFFSPSEGVTYMQMGSVATNAGGYSADTLDPEKVLIPCYDVLHSELENFDPNDLANYSTYNTVTVKGDDMIISVYHYNTANPEAGGTLYDQFALTKK